MFANQQHCKCIRLYSTFLCRRCTNSTSNCPISRFWRTNSLFKRPFSHHRRRRCLISLISRFHVRYGDKTPKFIFGRLFGIAWILIGLVVIAVFTATATSSLSVSPSDLAVLEGTTVRKTLKISLYLLG